MKIHATRARRGAQALAAALLLAGLGGCGGGGTAGGGASAAGAAADRPGMQALGASTPGSHVEVAVTADMVLDWAQYKYPELFPKAVAVAMPAVEYGGVVYNARAYGGSWGWRYLGITADGKVFGLGDFTNNRLQAYDTIDAWAPQVRADACGVTPSLCAASQPAGPLNDCTMSATRALVPGTRFIATYARSGSSPGEDVMDVTMQTLASFDGQSAMRAYTRLDSTNTVSGVTSASVSEAFTYLQDGGNGYLRTLGTESSFSAGGVVTSSRTAFDPASVNAEFSLQAGQSLTKSTTSVTTVGGPFDPAAAAVVTSTVYSFAGRETISVRGRSYDTCRYTSHDAATQHGTTTTWYLVDVGFPVRTETTGSRATVSELVSATLNGAPL